jgi:multicomponent Na+:H+ antiporter subunit D
MLAATKAGNVIPALAIAFGTVISAFYYMRVLSFFYSSGDPPPRQTNPYWNLVIAGACSLCCVFLGIVPLVPSLWKLFSDIGLNAVDTAEYISTILSK